jgi:hypothetical protein
MLDLDATREQCPSTYRTGDETLRAVRNSKLDHLSEVAVDYRVAQKR